MLPVLSWRAVMQDATCVAIGIGIGPDPSLFGLTFSSPVMVSLSYRQSVTSGWTRTESNLVQGQ